MGARDHDSNINHLARSLTTDQALHRAYRTLRDAIDQVIQTYDAPYQVTGPLCEARGYSSEMLRIELETMGLDSAAAKMLAEPE